MADSDGVEGHASARLSVLSCGEQPGRKTSRSSSTMDSYADPVRRAAESAGGEPTPCFVFADRRAKLAALRAFYKTQQSLLTDYEHDARLVLDSEQGATAAEALSTEADRLRRTDRLLVQVTFWVNLLLLLSKIVATVLSHSLSIMSTVVDSVVDLVSSTAIWLTARAIQNVKVDKYPRGCTKLEPITFMVVAIMRGVANCIMAMFSLQTILEDRVDPDVELATIVILLVGMAVKLALYVLCLRQKTPSAAVLALDQRNDMIANAVALACGYVATVWWPYVDPIGAILVCAYISMSWFASAAGQVPLLSGRTAPARYLSRILHVAMSHDERIVAVRSLHVYHHSAHYAVELHLVLSARLTLRQLHDVVEPLRHKLEKLPYVECAFVHLAHEHDGDKCDRTSL